MPSRNGSTFWGHTMQNVQPDNLDSMPLRQSSSSVGTIALRFVGLLTLAVLAMSLIWSR
jgi:hypothetical protein